MRAWDIGAVEVRFGASRAKVEAALRGLCSLTALTWRARAARATRAALPGTVASAAGARKTERCAWTA